MKQRGGFLDVVVVTLMGLAQGAILGIALLLVAATIAAAFGLIPWPNLALSFGGVAVPSAGMWVQIGLCVVFVLLFAFVPANARMARLERSHRSFAMGMEDVSRAYRMAHAADRAGVFSLSTEFDNVRARIEHLRKHPDLAHLEPELLQMAAQMSFETRELARAYSDEKVQRARSFLKQRQEDIDALGERVTVARRTCDELRRWLTDVEAEERQVQVQLKRLEADLREILPTLGYDFDLDDLRDANVVSLPKPQK
jgi:membrane protein implicated in regulation of membrane protease activity